MKIFIFLLLLGIHSAAAVIHSLKYFITGSSQIQNLPELVIVGVVDEVQMFHYDSNTMKAEPKQDWMEKITDPEHWERLTQISLGKQQTFKADIEILKQRFNQTEGLFILFNGLTAAKQQAVFTKHQWENNRAFINYMFNYFSQIFPDWLKMYVDYGRSSLMRTDLPSVSLLQKTSSSAVSCHATGFYPSRAEMFWRKDGEEIHEGVTKGEILPNNDGTFQMSVDLSAPEDWTKYECVFQLSGAKEDVVTRLEKTKIRTNEGSSPAGVGGVVVGVLVGIIIIIIIIIIITVGVMWWRRLNKGEKTH
uniref:Ig-like domain-containing protein n=1 Tax=Kryptolebias marmoratus TaxID=37003 RepID=A0A3Q3BHZ9_KRYMA